MPLILINSTDFTDYDKILLNKYIQHVLMHSQYTVRYFGKTTTTKCHHLYCLPSCQNYDTAATVTSCLNSKLIFMCESNTCELNFHRYFKGFGILFGKNSLLSPLHEGQRSTSAVFQQGS